MAIVAYKYQIETDIKDDVYFNFNFICPRRAIGFAARHRYTNTKILDYVSTIQQPYVNDINKMIVSCIKCHAHPYHHQRTTPSLLSNPLA